MDGFLLKPFRMEDMKRTLAAHLGEKPVAPAGAPAQAQPPASEPAAPDPLDRELLASFDGLEASDGSPLVARILRLFCEHAPVQLSALEAEAMGADLRALAEAAHSLKSVCSSIGARQAAAACGKLEEAARTGSLADPISHMAEISAEIRRALEAARALRSAA